MGMLTSRALRAGTVTVLAVILMVPATAEAGWPASISSARYYYRGGKYSLTLGATATAYGQTMIARGATRSAYNEAQNRAGWWRDSNGMYNQFYCHAWYNVPREWHIEPGRPDPGLWSTIGQVCNPPNAWWD